jgi:hypothetical protein
MALSPMRGPHTPVVDGEALYQQLLNEIRMLHLHLPVAATRLPAVSAWSVGEHLSHMARLDIVVAPRLLGPTPEDPGLTPAGPEALAIIAAGTLPRGRARAPASVQPTTTDPAGLLAELQAAERSIQSLHSRLASLCADASLIRHTVFGGLNRRQMLEIMSIHHRHHLAIIADIRAGS